MVRRLRPVLLLPLLGVALVATGCGGDDSAVQEVPGPPVTLTVPHQKATPAPAAQEDTPATNQAPAADGSPPEQFEQFCEENAGAC